MFFNHVVKGQQLLNSMGFFLCFSNEKSSSKNMKYG